MKTDADAVPGAEEGSRFCIVISFGHFNWRAMVWAMNGDSPMEDAIELVVVVDGLEGICCSPSICPAR